MLLTTSELIGEAKKLIDADGVCAVQINHNKLLRWQREGLLPRQKSSSAGPGGRQESLWDRGCLDRLQIIAGCIKENRLNRKSAEYALIAGGFGVEGTLLKKHLLAICKQMSIDLKKLHRSNSNDPVDRAANLERSTSDGMSPFGEVVKKIFTACRLGYLGLNQEERHLKFLAILASFFQPVSAQKLIENTKPEYLINAYQNPNVVYGAAAFYKALKFMNGQTNTLDIPKMKDIGFLFQMLDQFAPNPNKKLRRKKPYPYSDVKARYTAHLAATLMFTIFDKHKESLLPLIPLIILEVVNNSALVIPDDLKKMLTNGLNAPNDFLNLPSMPQ